MILSKLKNQSTAYSQLAGILYLTIAIIGGFSIGYVPSVIFPKGDALLSFEHLTHHYTLFKLGISGDILVLVMEVLLTVMLNQMFRSYSATVMKIATYARLAMAIIMGVNLVNFMIPAIIIDQPQSFKVLSSTELEILSTLFFKLHKFGELAWQIFFGIHLFSLGYVVLKSKQTSRWLGILMLLGGVGYFGDSFIQFTWVNGGIQSFLFSALLILAVIAEFWFAFWLLYKGNKQNVASKSQALPR